MSAGIARNRAGRKEWRERYLRAKSDLKTSSDALQHERVRAQRLEKQLT